MGNARRGGAEQEQKLKIVNCEEHAVFNNTDYEQEIAVLKRSAQLIQKEKMKQKWMTMMVCEEYNISVGNHQQHYQ